MDRAKANEDPEVGASAADGFQAISFWVKKEEYAVDILSIEEIRGWTPTTEVPNSAHYMRGVINLRGAVVPIFDLRARFGFGLTEPTATHVVIVVSVVIPGAVDMDTGIAANDIIKKVGLLVDGVNDIISANRGSVAPVPEIGRQAGTEFLDGLITVRERMVGLVNLNRLFDGLVRSSSSA